MWQPELEAPHAGYARAEEIRGRCRVRKTDTFKAVKEQLASIAEDEPDESTEFDGMVDLHWLRFVLGGRTAGEFAPKAFTQARNRRLASVVLR
jgi:hypothetical protein